MSHPDYDRWHQDWLILNGMTQEEYDCYLEHNVIIRSFKPTLPPTERWVWVIRKAYNKWKEHRGRLDEQ